MQVDVYDNGGRTADRYTIFVWRDPAGRAEAYGMSDNATAPNGFNQFIGMGSEVEQPPRDSKLVRLVDLPKSTLVAIIDRITAE